MGHYFSVGRIWTFAAFTLLVFCAACTSSGPGKPHTSALSSHPTVSVPPPTTSAPPSSSHAGPPKPPTPSLPTDVPTTGPNAKPGEKPPIMSLEATQHTPDGAKAFAQFFIKTIDWGYATMSGSYIRHYAATMCTACNGIAATIDKDRRAGDRYIGGRLTIRTATAKSASSINVTVDGTSREVVTKTGKFISGDPAHPNLTYSLTVKWSPNAWVVDNLAVVV